MIPLAALRLDGTQFPTYLTNQLFEPGGGVRRAIQWSIPGTGDDVITPQLSLELVSGNFPYGIDVEPDR